MFFIWCAGELVSLIPCSVPRLMASCLVCEGGGSLRLGPCTRDKVLQLTQTSGH